MQEVEAICSQVLIINEGKIAAQGTPEEIAGTMKGGDTWELVMKGSDAQTIQGKLARLNGITSIALNTQEDGTVHLSFFIPGAKAADPWLPPAGEQIFDWAVAEGLKILGMNRKKLSIEDIFVSLTAEEHI